MFILINCFFLVFISEMGDKTQLLALLLALKFKNNWLILSGIFVATVLNHALAAYLGGFVGSYLDTQTLNWLLAFSFWIFAVWILIPDKVDEFKNETRFGPFVTTVVLFFIAEMGDKTQLATVALGAQYNSTVLVTLGSTAGMLASNALAIFFGERLLKKIPMKWVRIFSSLSFAAFGFAIIVTQ